MHPKLANISRPCPLQSAPVVAAAVLFWSLSACRPLSTFDNKTSSSVETADSSDSGTRRPSPRDSAAAPEPKVTTASVASAPLTDDWIFTLDRVHTIDIELPHDSWSSLGTDPYAYATGNFTLDGERIDEVGVRLRGKIGSFRTLAGKPKIKIDFNRIIEDQRFYGLESLSLNSSVADCSYLKEVVAAKVYTDAGVPTSRTSYAQVRVNGADYGLYVIVETQDDRFLKRTMDDPTGNLYDGKYVWYGGSSYTLLDFSDGNDTLFQLEEGEYTANADISAVSNSIVMFGGTDDFYAELGHYVSWPALHRAWAAEEWIGQNDGYCINKNNYRVYFDPTDGRAQLIPWDNDNTFLYDYQWGRSWSSPYGNLAGACLAHAECRADWAVAVGELLGAINPTELVEFVAEIDALTAVAAMADPRRECDDSSVPSNRAHVSLWVSQRTAEVQTRWGL